MKKFFKILRKIIKILLKSILWLILWIIVILWIILAIINNKTIKEYEDYDGNIKYTMNKDFKMEKWTEITLNLKKWIITYNWIEFDDDSKIYWWYIYEKDIIKLKKINLKDVKQAYKNWEIENWFEIIRFFIDWEVIEYHSNWQIMYKRIYVNWIGDWLENWPFISYDWNGKTREEWNYINWEKNWSRTWYYDDGNIRYIFDETNLNWTGYYENWNIEWIQNQENITWYYKNWKIKYILNTSWYNNIYDENWNLIKDFYCKKLYFIKGDYICN